MNKMLLCIIFCISTINSETIQCTAFLLKSKQYLDLYLLELKKRPPNYCRIADILEQEINYLGSLKTSCIEKESIKTANKLIIKLSPQLLYFAQKCGH